MKNSFLSSTEVEIKVPRAFKDVVEGISEEGGERKEEEEEEDEEVWEDEEGEGGGVGISMAP
jgi:hypothetical protein